MILLFYRSDLIIGHTDECLNNIRTTFIRYHNMKEIFRASIILFIDYNTDEFKILKNRYGSDGNIHPLKDLDDKLKELTGNYV